MCGIAGSTDDPEGRAARLMAERLRHRGPDDEGCYTDASAGTSLAARRLAILDLAGGHQPLANEDGSVWVAFNGAIYNYPRLREQLRERGHTFRTGCDTEVLVHLYEEYGEEMVHALEGMFAFAIWDERRARLFLARDRFGEKPLFVHERGGEVYFASELTALTTALPDLGELSPEAVDAYFVFGYVPGPGTIVEDIHQLPPGSSISWTRGEGGRRRRWWSPPEATGRLHEPKAALAAEAERLLTDSVRSRMIADVPIGVFLSGGIDSTLVTSAAVAASSRPIKTFTVGYDVGPFDETARARRVAHRLGTDHHEVTLTEADVGERAPRLMAAMDQPLADKALVSLHALSDFARPLVTVALGGEGADELFGGYPRYRWIERSRRISSALPTAVVAPGLLRSVGGWDPMRRLIERTGPGPLLERNLDWVTAGRRHRREGLYGPRLAAVGAGRILDGLVERAGQDGEAGVGRTLMRLDQVDYLPDDVLVKTDRAGMAVSMEIRTAYLHRGLAEFAASVDPSLHLGGSGKSLLHAMLPAEMRSGRSRRFRKAAFNAPAAEWLRGSLAPVLSRQLEVGSVYEEGWFDRVVARRLTEEHLAGTADHSDLLWGLLAFGLWNDRRLGIDGS